MVTCVRGAALYGLHAVGVGQKQVDRLTIVLTKHVRAIVGSFVHMHKESSRDLCSRFVISDPLIDIAARRSWKLPEPVRIPWSTMWEP